MASSHRGQQYSIIALTDSSGTIKERYAYSAYGVPTITDVSGTARTLTAEGNRYTYTGREWDSDLGLYHYRAGMYDPSKGRFLSRDPIGYVDGESMYRAYFAPAMVDPTGEILVWPLDPFRKSIPLPNLQGPCDVPAVTRFCSTLTENYSRSGGAASCATTVVSACIANAAIQCIFAKLLT